MLIVFAFVFMVFFLSVFLSIIFGSDGDIAKRNQALDDKYYADFNYTFSGVITYYRQTDRGGSSGGPFGIIKFDIKSSDIEEYDPRDSSKFYFTILKKEKGVAVVNVTHMSPGFRWDWGKEADILKGDSIVFDGLKDQFRIFRGDSVTYQIERTSISWEHGQVAEEIFIDR